MPRALRMISSAGWGGGSSALVSVFVPRVVRLLYILLFYFLPGYEYLSFLSMVFGVTKQTPSYSKRKCQQCCFYHILPRKTLLLIPRTRYSLDPVITLLRPLSSCPSVSLEPPAPAHERKRNNRTLE